VAVFDSAIAALSHLLLDWTNNYGLRPFFPFNPRCMPAAWCLLPSRAVALLVLPLVVPWLLGWWL